jgi:hypothetical protein
MPWHLVRLQTHGRINRSSMRTSPLSRRLYDLAPGPRQHDHAFIAKDVNYLGHRDLHETHVPDERTDGVGIVPLIAFLDEAL